MKSTLVLGRITMRNYRTYSGETVIDLSRDPERPVTILEHHDLIGSEVSILDVVRWCLYGEDGREPDDSCIMSDDILAGMSVGDSNETSVEIRLYEGDNILYEISRTVKFAKSSESPMPVHHAVAGDVPRGIEVSDSVEFGMSSDTGDWTIISGQDAQAWIEALFPKLLSPYFLVDAQAMPGSHDLRRHEPFVEAGLENMSILSMVDGATDDLRTAASLVRKDIHKEELVPLWDRLACLNQSIDQAEVEIKSMIKERTKIRIEKWDIRSSRIYDMYIRRNPESYIYSIDPEIVDLKKIREKWYDDACPRLVRYNTILRLRDSAQTSLDKCRTWMETRSCVREALNGLARSSTVQCIGIGMVRWEGVLVEASEARGEIKGLVAEREDLDQKHDDRTRKRYWDYIRDGNYNDDSNLSRLSKLNEMDDDLTGRMAMRREDLKKARLERQTAYKEYMDSLGRHPELASYRNRLILADKLGDILEKCRDEMAGEVREIVQKKTTAHLRKLVPRFDSATVRISEDYAMHVITRNGVDAAPDRGEWVCLFISYVAAMHDVAPRCHFLLVDSLFTMLSQYKSVTFARHLLQIFPGMQMTLLTSHDLRYTHEDLPSIKDMLAGGGSLWKYYVLKPVSIEDAAAGIVPEEVQ